jgi:hypothetical protein
MVILTPIVVLALLMAMEHLEAALLPDRGDGDGTRTRPSLPAATPGRLAPPKVGGVGMAGSRTG